MSSNARSEVRLIISGTAVGLEQALAEAQKGLAGFGAAATKAGAQAGTTLAQGEARAGHEAQTMGARVRVAADMVGLLGIESGESSAKVFLLRDALGELGHSFGGIRGAILGGIGAMAAFGALDFMRESVGEAMKGEAAWARLGTAYKDNAEGLEHVKRTIEDTRATWEKLGLTQAEVADMAARSRGLGLDPAKVLGDPAALADVAKVLRMDVGGALDAIARPRGVQQVLSRLGLGKREIAETVAQLQGASAAQRVLFLEQRVAASAFAGQGLADAGTAGGKFRAFHTALADLREEVGTALIPALTQLATALTSMLQAADAMARPFGGLANVLRVLFLPMLAGGLLLFTNLRGVLTGMVDLLLGRLMGAFGQTASSLAEADATARDLTRDLESIPEAVTTTAAFVPATAIKDAYKANIYSIPTTWMTRATFVPATVTQPAVTPVHVPVIYDGSLSEQAATPVRVPVTTVVDNAQVARSRAQIAKDLSGVNVPVKAHWAAGTLDSLKMGLGLGAGVAITDAIFHSVTIEHVKGLPVAEPATVKPVLQPLRHAPPTPHAPAPAHVYVTNIGPLGEALVNAGKGKQALRVQVDGPVGLKSGTTVGLAGTPTVKISATTPIQTTVTLPSTINVHAHQSGGWKVSLAPDAFARFGEMVAEVAVGTMLANLLGNLIGKIPFGKILDVLKNLFKGKGKGGGADEEPAIPLLPQWSQSTAAQMVDDMLKGSAGVPLERSLVPVGAGAGGKATSTFIMTGLMDGLRGVDWGAVARFMVGGWALAVGGWLLAGVGKTLFGSPQLAGAETLAEAKKAGLTDAQAKTYVKQTNKAILAAHKQQDADFGAIAGAILGSIKDGIKRGATGLINAIIDLFNAAISKVTFGHGPHIGHVGAGGTSGVLGGALAGGKSGLHALAPGAAAHLTSLVSGALGTTGGAGTAAVHHTTTLHATINVNGAQDPHRVAQEVNHALADFMGGVKASRRLHG